MRASRYSKSEMNQTWTLIAVVTALVAACAAVFQATRAISRARIRRQQRLVRLSSVVTGEPAEAPDNQFS